MQVYVPLSAEKTNQNFLARIVMRIGRRTEGAEIGREEKEEDLSGG
jgi:hypothetical protein